MFRIVRVGRRSEYAVAVDISNSPSMIHRGFLMKKRESQQRAAHMGVIVSEIVGIYYIEILMDNHWQDSSEIWAMNVPLS